MYENITFEVILNRMINKVREQFPDLDTREGSVIYNALAPAAAELQNMYIELDYYVDQFFSDTQNRENLIRRCKDLGMVPYPAVKAVLKGKFNMDIPIGSRFSAGSLVFKAAERLEEEHAYRMECETAGAAGTEALGEIVPIEYIAGLTRAELTEVLSPGSGEEDTEHLRKRYHTAVQKPSTSGNKHDYYNWAMECAGVGAARVFPLADGPGTVKVVVTNREMKAAEEEIIRDVTSHIEELRPVGAALTTVSAVEKPIRVSANIKLQNGISLETVRAKFMEKAEEHLKKYALQAADVSLAIVGDLLINIPGVLDYKNLKLNGLAENVELADTETAVMGTVVLETIAAAGMESFIVNEPG